MKIQFNTGNFSLEIAGEFSEDQKAKAMESALRYIVQRDIASKVYIKLAGVAGKKAERILPKDFERESIGYTPDNATAFLEATKAELAKLGSFQVSVGQHVAGEGGDAKPTKEAQDDWVKMQALPEEKFRANCKLIGLDADDYDDESGVKALHAFYLKAKREAAEAARLASKGKLSM